VKTIRLALLLAALGAASSAFAETIDFAISISEGGVPVAGGSVVYALVVTANRWTDAQEPFIVRLDVPPELEVSSVCSDAAQFDPATRVLTWAARLDNPVIALHSCPLTFRVAPSLAPGSTFSLTATLTTSTSDPNAANNTATHTGVVRAASDLAIESSADVLRFRPGTMVTYTFNASNLGPQDAQDVSFVDQLSPYVDFVSFQQLSGPPASVDAAPQDTGSGVCFPPRCGAYIEAHIPLLPDGSTATFRLVLQARTSVEAANISNRAIVQSTSIDPFERNNDRDLFTFAGPNADLAVTSSGTPDATGLRIPITIEVSNEGPDAVHSVTVGNALADGGRYDFVETVRFLSATPSQGTCSEPALTQVAGSPEPPPFWTLDCALGTLAAGAKAVITVVIERTSLSGPFILLSSASPTQNDPLPANNVSQRGFTFGGRRRAVQ
jgi:uncharacterized repeat protein (TIGR01451 family)